ncbi:MAG: hypothetical protein Q7T55_02360, partial [Solirubrobacteraceae bacterium]|nr:hypothetical protein [Solirubrobacteraceae bacterium]
MATFAVESFERLPGAPGWVTLRLEGQWTGDLAGLSAPELVIDDGRRDFNLPPVSGPGTGIPTEGQRVWRVAFSVPEDVLKGGKLAFAARLGDLIIDLPRPVDPVRPTGAAGTSARTVERP